MKKYESIVSGLRGMVTKLHRLAESNEATIETKEDDRSRLLDVITNLRREREQCLKTAENIEALVG